ncbi:hypothetical protein, partial [Marinilabilia sp.]
ETDYTLISTPGRCTRGLFKFAPLPAGRQAFGDFGKIAILNYRHLQFAEYLNSEIYYPLKNTRSLCESSTF